MYKFLAASKSCCSLGTHQISSESTALKQHYFQTPSIELRRWISSCDMTRDQYLKLKHDFLEKYYEKEKQLQEALAKLNFLRQRRPKNDLLVSINSPVECLKSQNIAESGIKMNCIRATCSTNELHIMVAADKLCEGAVQKMELKKRTLGIFNQF